MSLGDTTSDQGASPAPAAPAADPPAAPAIPSEAVAPNPNDTTTDVKVPADTGAPAADAQPASTDLAPAKTEPPASPTAGKEPVAPPAKAEAAPDEEETEEEKAEIAALPVAAQPAARRNRKEARQFRSFKTGIGGDGFLEDAKLLVPTFHTKPAPDFDAVLQERSPEKRRELYNHMVHSAIGAEPDRQVLIKILAQEYRAEIEKELGVQTPKPAEERKPESHVEPTAPANHTQSIAAALDDLLIDPYFNAEQRTALEAAKAALTAPLVPAKPAEVPKDATIEAKLAALTAELQQLRDEKASTQTQSVEQEEQKLGSEFIGEVMTFAETRLGELGLSAAEGDPPELVNYITAERKKILDLLPTRFEAHENAKNLISLLEGKFKKIPTLPASQKAAEKQAAWRFQPAAKACVDDILGKEVAACLYAIEAARSARQAPLNQGQRKEVVGHQPPAALPEANTLVKGKGVDALWEGLLNTGAQNGFGA